MMSITWRQHKWLLGLVGWGKVWNLVYLILHFLQFFVFLFLIFLKSIFVLICLFPFFCLWKTFQLHITAVILGSQPITSPLCHPLFSPGMYLIFYIAAVAFFSSPWDGLMKPFTLCGTFILQNLRLPLRNFAWRLLHERVNQSLLKQGK